MATAITDPRMALMQDVAGFVTDPLGFSYYIYPWNAGELRESNGPRKWQRDILEAITRHLQNPDTQFTPFQVAVSSGHGIGKSALLAMVMHWAMSTCEDCKVVLTANTDTQLRTKTWPEVAKWFGLALNKSWFQVNAESITIKDKARERQWRADRISWSENNTEAFAGLHNKGKRIVVIFDEASAIADKVWEVTEGALTDEETEILWLAFGNPTRTDGRFRECFGKFKHRWQTYQIDARHVEGTDKPQFAKWAEDYGEDSDWFRVRVRGEFPRAGSNQFIPSDVVAQCRKHQAAGFESLPKILSVDVARFGDDQTVIGTRQGRKCRILAKLRGLDTVQVALRTIACIEEENPDAIVIDADGLGAGVHDEIKFRGFGRRLFEFHGGASADDAAKYYNKRAEVWGLMRDALKATMEIPDDAELADDLTGPQYGFSGKQQIQLEKKEDMKKRGLHSPDCGDMLAMTFAVRVAMPKPLPKPQYITPGTQPGAWMV